MQKVIEAVYEKGIFKPLEWVNMKEGERIKIKIGNMLLSDIVKKYREFFEDIDEDLATQLISERR
jgi:predicted DNA-binding antitoxin AbrB/MazE fold protein